MKNKCLKKINRIVFLLVGGIILATVLQFLVFLLPTDRMGENVKSSVGTYRTEGAYRMVNYGFYNTMLDNYTDACMLLCAVYDGDESLPKRAMNVYSRQVEKGNYNYMDSLLAFCDGKEMDSVHKYFWYWHGYLVFLKPLLLFFNYGDIRMLNMCLQTVLFAAFLLCMYRKGLKHYILPFILGYLLLMPITVSMSLQFSSCYYVMMLGGIALLHFYEKLKAEDAFYAVFLLLGMSTSFLDFLTYPLVTLCVPLILYFILNEQDKILPMAKRMIGLGLSWGAGYIGMWAGKWLMASIFLQKNCFVMGIRKVFQHTSMNVGMTEQKFTITEVFQRNFLWMTHKGYMFVLIPGILYLLVRLLRTGVCRASLRKAVPLAVIAIIPVVWYCLASAHSYIHYWMEYRHCLILVFALLSLLVKLRKEDTAEPSLTEG